MSQLPLSNTLCLALDLLTTRSVMDLMLSDRYCATRLAQGTACTHNTHIRQVLCSRATAWSLVELLYMEFSLTTTWTRS